jgi:hypothetical protein
MGLRARIYKNPPCLHFEQQLFPMSCRPPGRHSFERRRYEVYVVALFPLGSSPHMQLDFQNSIRAEEFDCLIQLQLTEYRTE